MKSTNGSKPGWTPTSASSGHREGRYLALEEGLHDLRNVRVLTTGLSWNDGMLVDGGGALGRYFDDEPFKKALWFQAVGDTRGQAWVGLFRIATATGVLDFVPVGSHLPQGAGARRWPFCRGNPSP